MLKFLAKYTYLILIFNSILLKVSFIPSIIPNVVFYGLIWTGIFFIPFLEKTIPLREVVEDYSILFLFIIANLFHVVFFTPTNIDAWLYFFTKLSLSILIIYVIKLGGYSFILASQFYFFRAAIFIFLIGLFLGSETFSNRYTFGLFNPNDTGAIASIALGFSFFFFDSARKKKWTKVGQFFLFFVILASGSRGAVLITVIGFLLSLHLSFKGIVKYVFILILLIPISLTLLPTTALSRYQRKNFTNRASEHFYALATIEKSPFVGYGIDKYGWLDRKLIKESNIRRWTLGPHQMYFSFFIMYGKPLGIVLILALIFSAFYYYFSWRKKYKVLRSWMFIVFASLVMGFGESFVVGVNETITLIFWLSLSLLGSAKLSYIK